MSPQKENGYTAIANEIMEALMKYPIPGTQMQCLLTILRKTYGYNKKSDAISLSQFVEFTNLDRRHIHRSLQELKKKNVIRIKKRSANDGTKLTSIYSLNKIYTSWVFVPKKARGSAKLGTKGSAKLGTDKRQLKDNKEKIIKERLGQYEKIISIPKNYAIQPEHINYAISKKLIKSQAEDQFDGFVIHFNKTGKKYKDWYAAYQSWVRNAIKWGNVQIIKPNIETQEDIDQEIAEKMK